MLTTAALCLATAIYFEARGEPLAGQIAVGNVIMNRVQDGRFPDNVCDVVKEGPTYSWAEHYPVRNQCQFSFYCDGKSETPTDIFAWETANVVARGILSFRFIDLSEGAVFYHAKYVNPSWAEAKTHTITINNHVFYRWKDE